MSENKSIYIFGYSGHAYVVIETILALGYKIKGYFDVEEASNNPYNLSYMGFENNVDLNKIVGLDYVFPCIGDNQIRNKLMLRFREKALHQCNLIDPTSYISPTAKIGLSTYIGKGSTVNALAEIGDACIINTGAIVEHECVISDSAHIGPGAVLCGNVSVGKETFIGAKSVIRPNISINDEVILGAGSVLVKSIEKKGVWMGNPAKYKA